MSIHFWYVQTFVFGCCWSAGAVSSTSARLRMEVASQRLSTDESPLNRVVQLLKEMKAQLEKEADADEEAYSKMTCWCDTNEKLKTKAIADADTKISEHMSEVESLSAQFARLGTQIDHLKVELEEKREALKQATALREKEQAAFMSEEKELVESITMLTNAIAVLGRHQSGLVQMTPAVQASLESALRLVAMRHEELLEMSMDGVRRHGAAASLQQPVAFLSLAEHSKAVSSESAGSTMSAIEASVWSALRQEGETGSALPAEYALQVLATAAEAARKAAPQASFAQQPAHLQPYAPQSSQIFGVLEQMKEEFEGNLKTAQQNEVQGKAAYEELKAASEEQIAASTVKLDDMQAQHSSTSKALADTKEDLATTTETRKSDVEFLSDLRLKCQTLDQDWEARSKARAQEIKAVGDTIVIVTEDDARDLFSKKLGSASGDSFLQVSALKSASDAAMMARAHASSALLGVARRLMNAGVDKPSDDNSWVALKSAWKVGEERPHEQLAAMAITVRLDPFTKVTAAIDTMIADLKSQQEEEVAMKANCTAEFGENDKLTYAANKELGNVKDLIAELESTMKTLDEEIAAANETISRTEVEFKAASETRKQENSEFQEEVMDQRAVQQILKKAIARLSSVYKKDAALVQQEPAPPVQFQPYKQNAGASPVMSLLESIVEDSVAVEKDAMASEQGSQAAYESFASDTDTAIKMLNQAIESKTKQKEAANAEKEQAEADQNSLEGRLEDLAATAMSLHQECDFVLQNFDIRQKARLQETEALQQAKAFLKGMKDSK